MSERDLIEVYRARDSLQAHLLEAALESAGIRAVIEGDLLQGAIGEAPAGWSGAPRILVDSRDAPAVRAIITRLESGSAAGPAGDDVCLACGSPMRGKDETCPACGWTYRGGAEGTSD